MSPTSSSSNQMLSQPNTNPETVPLSRQAALHAEVQNLIDQDVLEPSTDHTEWVNSFVIVEKKVVMDTSNSHSPNHSQTKKIRLCLDPRDLNEALEREPYYSRSVDELIAKFNGAKFFTIVDELIAKFNGGKVLHYC